MSDPSKPILVVGGAGYIGSHVVLHLLEQGRDVVVCDNFSTGFRQLLVDGAKLEEGDLGDRGYLKGLLSRYDFDAVMHLAAWACVPESVDEPGKYYLNNVANTINLLDAMRRHGCKRFIFSSSAATFGQPEAIPITEDAPQVPTNPYGRTKLIIEHALADMADAAEMEYVSLRYFNAAGADPQGRLGEMHDPETHLIPLVFKAISGERESITVLGTDYPTADGTCVRDYIHVSDLATAHVLALEHLVDGRGSDVFNLGNGEGHSVRQVIETVEKVTDRKVPVVEAGRRPGDPAALVASSSKIKHALGWRPRFASLESIVETAWNWEIGSAKRTDK